GALHFPNASKRGLDATQRDNQWTTFGERQLPYQMSRFRSSGGSFRQHFSDDFFSQSPSFLEILSCYELWGKLVVSARFLPERGDTLHRIPHGTPQIPLLRRGLRR